MIVLDASVMIGLLDARDVHSEAARRMLVSAADQRIVAHRLTIAEALVQAVRTGRGDAAAARLDEVGIGRVDEPDDPLEFAHLRARTGLPMPDCCVLYAAVRNRSQLATFDRRLVEAARRERVEIIDL